MKIVIDMNLSPGWVGVFVRNGIEAVHWSSIGSASAHDSEILQWAAQNGFAVFTHALDFGSILAASHSKTPSVLQVRAQDVLPETLEGYVISALAQFRDVLEAGALVVVEPARIRARVLPLP